MYIPKHFSNQDLAFVHNLIAENAFGLLMSPVGNQDGAPEFSHIPMIIVDDGTEYGCIIGHVAKANLHWKSFDSKAPAFAVFSGPHAYVSPNWYVSKAMVPTWNYAAVHVHGAPQAIHDDVRAEEILRQLIAAFEHDGTGNWSMDQLPDGHLSRKLKGIVAFDMPITGYEIKVKMSQNRGADDVAGIVSALKQSDHQSDQATAEMMQQLSTG